MKVGLSVLFLSPMKQSRHGTRGLLSFFPVWCLTKPGTGIFLQQTGLTIPHSPVAEILVILSTVSKVFSSLSTRLISPSSEHWGFSFSGSV